MNSLGFLGLLVVIALFVWLFLSSRQQGDAISGLEASGDFKISKLLRLGMEEAIVIDTESKKIGFVGFQVGNYLPDGTLYKFDRFRSFTCNLSDIQKVSISPSEEQPKFGDVMFKFKSEIPIGNIGKHVSAFVTMDIIKSLQRDFLELPFSV
jgi:hypothetical protein